MGFYTVVFYSIRIDLSYELLCEVIDFYYIGDRWYWLYTWLYTFHQMRKMLLIYIPFIYLWTILSLIAKQWSNMILYDINYIEQLIANHMQYIFLKILVTFSYESNIVGLLLGSLWETRAFFGQYLFIILLIISNILITLVWSLVVLTIITQ